MSQRNKQSYVDVTVSNSGGAGVAFNGDQMFEALHYAVDWLKAEEPGSVTIEDLGRVFKACGEVVEQLVDARNELRSAKGLPPIYPGTFSGPEIKL